jgi:phosphatidate phosphatase APP1
MRKRTTHVKVYHGYGYMNNLVIYGHVLAGKEVERKKYSHSVLYNIIHLLRLFFVKPIAGARVQMEWNGRQLETITESDGFFRFGWISESPVSKGWHPVFIHHTEQDGNLVSTGEGALFVPHRTQFAFISDIDDTILISHSATIFKRITLLLSNNPRTRKPFEDVEPLYSKLARAHTTPDLPNPFFYVSSSEWNLYDDLVDFFSFNKLPEGIFLLNQIKKWYQFFTTGKTKHSGKLIRITRILESFPEQKFVLLGDNSQQDPEIYTAIATHLPGQVFAVFIRDIRPSRRAETITWLNALEPKKIHYCLFRHTSEAVRYSASIRLL